MKRFVNVTDYGAIGDGKTDNRKAFEKAIKAAKGKQIKVPAGTYKIDSPIQASRPFHMTGVIVDGESASVIQSSTAFFEKAHNQSQWNKITALALMGG